MGRKGGGGKARKKIPRVEENDIWYQVPGTNSRYVADAITTLLGLQFRFGDKSLKI